MLLGIKQLTTISEVRTNMQIFQENKKMKKASFKTFNFSLPAIDTCPGAGSCAGTKRDGKGFCFAYLEQIRYPSAMAYRRRMHELSKTDQFVDVVGAEVKRLETKHGKLAIRIHASGDFYSVDYFDSWVQVARNNSGTIFYAYTKSVAIVKHWVKLNGPLPENLVIIFSLGGLQDILVDLNTDRHSRIFADTETALAEGYAIAAEDDAVAWSNPNYKVGLVMFGARAKKGNEVLGNLSQKLGNK
jgi:Gene product 88